MPEIRIAINEQKQCPEVVISEEAAFVRIAYDRETGEFKLTFKPGLEGFISGSTQVETTLILPEKSIRAMAAALPPVDGPSEA